MKKPDVDLHDGVFILGLLLFSGGIALFSVPAAMIATGAIFLGIAFAGARGKK